MPTVVFVCQHGAAKSLIASEYFTRIAAQRGINYQGMCAGFEPYAEVPRPVVTGLAQYGIDVSGFTPRPVSGDTFADATHVVHFGCAVGPHVKDGVTVEDWGDVPAVSDGFAAAHDVIVRRVEHLADAILRETARGGSIPAPRSAQ